ncbi:MAG: hypothetical protein ACYTFG_15175, partial [Planctomycetota bacterium]
MSTVGEHAMDSDTVERLVTGVRIRLGRNLVLHTLCRVGFWAAVAFCVALPVHRLFSPPLGLWWVLAAAVGAALALGTALCLRSYPTRLRAAVAADKTFDLEEELSSALIMGSGGGAFARAFRERASSVASKMRPGGRFPFRPPLEGKMLPLPVIACGLMFLLVPDMDILGLLRTREEKEEIRKDLNATA